MALRSNKDSMVGVVVVTHDQACSYLESAARAIVGKIPQLTSVPVGVGEEFPSILRKISNACEEIDYGAGVLLLVDVHGSTPFHAAMSMLDGIRAAEVLCGVNLPMLIKMTTLDRRTQSPVTLAEELREAGRRSIRLGSELTGKVNVKETR
jgi:mannose PTS system EIIA component